MKTFESDSRVSLILPRKYDMLRDQNDWNLPVCVALLFIQSTFFNSFDVQFATADKTRYRSCVAHFQSVQNNMLRALKAACCFMCCVFELVSPDTVDSI